MDLGNKKYDIVLLTDSRYVSNDNPDWYVQNIFDEDELVTRALEKRGLRVWRTHWDNPDFDWSRTLYVIFRSTWDYFDRFHEFSKWLEWVSGQTRMINPYTIIKWNMDKHYLSDLTNQGINVPPTVYVEPGDRRTLGEIIRETGWSDIILKPCVSGAARHTYRLHPGNIPAHESIFKELISVESMMLQEFQKSVISKGELAIMLFEGKYSHTILKKAKAGDFRVHEDYGGSVHEYMASTDEIAFAEKVVSVCDPLPVYARVDAIWDNNNDLSVSELELIEPELWFRLFPQAAELFADAIVNHADQL
jgi:glutathione synthase/RimK-type ligase-like ATP-grasp enzyme